MANWRQKLKQAFADNGEDFNKMITTLSESDLDVEFDDGYGTEEGKPFTAWGDNNVYFPLCYDGAEFVGSAPRNPCKEPCSHQGG